VNIYVVHAVFISPHVTSANTRRYKASTFWLGVH